MRQLSDEELLAFAQKCYENRSMQQRQLEQEAIEYLAKLEQRKPHPYKRKARAKSASEIYREENWTLFTYRAKS